MSHFASLIANHRIVVCVGSGGVGKTTSAAALALWGALNGRRTAVLTIDPAKRLADCLGLDALNRQEEPLPPEAFAPYGLTPTGTLTALLVEQESAWQAAIERYIADSTLRQQIFANRFFQGLSQTFAGSHEYMALDTLAGLLQDGVYDLIIVDTPPSRQALDFLEAPRQLQSLLDHQMMQWFLRSSTTGWAAWSAVQRTSRFIFDKIEEATGVSAFREIAEFFTTLEHMFGDFGQRFSRVSRLLESEDTAFVLVTSPEEEVLAEAHELQASLNRLAITLKAVVVNRVHQEWLSPGRNPKSAETLVRHLNRTVTFPALKEPPAEWMAENFLAYQTLARGEQQRLDDFRRSIPPHVPDLVHIPPFPAFPADLGGLHLFHNYLFGTEPG